jgi:hypothetical protein
MALRVLREVSGEDSQRLDRAFRLTTSRPPNDDERHAMLEFLASQRQRISEGWLNPREILTGDPSKLATLPDGATPQDAAAWTLAARVLFNLDATITK